ncbi:rRNA pseudouridine synthase [Sphingobacterium faecium]|jgi:23S rRNA pseudouridine2605 synthase|uniref:pseudouridine synthase n=1 Tax=Sphingobacterium faecium TaxID=34087 RepID=UPI0021B4F889|nr:pseudouridine synthase [Sphingobacterium faecium]UXD69862.1 rRNA pseudouridine synthase [Sphingobacterium faecium]
MPFSNKRNSRDDNSKNSRSTSENFKPRGDRSKDDRSSNFKDSKRPRSSSFGNKDNTDRPYSNDKKSFGGDRPFKKFNGENSDRKRSFDKPFNKEGKSFGGDRPFKRDGESSDRKRSFDKPFNKEGRSFGGDRPFKRDGESSDRKRSFDKPFNKEGRSFGGDRPFKRDGESSDRKRSFDKPFNKEGRSFGGDRPFQKDGESSDRKRSFDKPFNKEGRSFGGDRPFKRDGESSDRKRSFDKPFNKEGRSFGGDRPFKKDGENSDRKRSFDKPFNKEGRSFQKSEGEQTDFKRPARDKSDRQYKSSYKKFNSEEDRKEGSTERRSSERPQRAKSSSQNDGLIRLNRYIANSGVCSRRKADELIAAGVVSVNGEAVTELGAKVDPAKDDIKYNGERLKREKMVYVLLNKPKDYITTTDDPQERHTVMELVSKATKERIYPVGRLDRNTTGLLLMTNDGNLAEKLSHPRNNISKIYNVELNKSLTQGDFNKIVFGLELEDGFVKPDDLSYVIGGSKKEIGVQIHSGKNRIVRRIFESLGYEVVKLDRVVYANLTKKDLPRGRWRYIEERELVQLKHLI